MSDFYASAPFTGVSTYPGLTLGTAATTVSSTGALDYAIRSIGYRKAQLSGATTPTTDVNTGEAFTGVLANKGCIFLLGLNAAGSLLCSQGAIEPLNGSGEFINAPQYGPVPSDFAPIAHVVVKAGSTANNTTGWIFGTSNFTGVTGVTCSAKNLMGSLPDRPQTS